MKTITILVIEDNPGDARLIEEYLKTDTSANYTINITSTLAESLKTLSNKKFDVVLVDLGLPDSQGIYTFHEIINASPRSPIVIITGTDDENLGLEAIRDGAQNYLVKNQINSALLTRTIKFAIEIKRKNIELKESREKYCSIFEGAASLILSVSPSGFIIDCNNRIQQSLGYSKDEVIGQPIKMIIHPDSYEKAKKSIEEVLKTGILYTGEFKMTRKDGEVIFVNVHSSALKDENNKNIIASCIIDDITKRILYEKKQLLTTKILSILNRSNEWHNLIYDILVEIKEFSGIEAVGIRYKEGDDYPYFDTLGFSDSFIEKENFLCTRNKKGEFIYDSDGKKFLEGMCGNIISKRTDSSLSFFTEAGSFWTNSTTNLLATTTDNERQTHTRNYCNAAGYESVALIPMISENETIGLLQLNDKRKNRFTEEIIHFYEDIGLTLGIAFKRIKIEKLISESEEQYRSLTENSPDLIARFDRQYRHLYVNSTAAKAGRYAPEEYIGKTIVEVGVPEQDAMKWEERIRTVFETGQIIDVEDSFETQNGLQYFNTKFVPEFAPDRSIHTVQSIARNITGRKWVEEALSKEKHLFNSLIETTPDSIYFKDRESRFIRINKTMAKRFGLNDPQEALDKTDFDFFDEEHARPAFEDEQQIIATGKPLIGLEEKEVWPDGRITWVSTIKMPLRDQTGKIIGIMGISRDITDRKRAEEALTKAKEKAEESDKLKTAFLQNISHEIRTPLNGIIGFSDMITNPNLPSEKREQYSEIIRDSGDQLISIVNDIIVIATIEAGQEKPYEKVTDINKLLQVIKSQNALKIEIKNLSFVVSSALTDDEAIVLVDEAKLLQILTNLVSNAIKFTYEGHIKVNCRLDDNFIKFAVEDTGIGIPPEMHEKIFDRFFQIDYSETRLYGGTGLGLSIVKSYVHFLNGEIYLDSKSGKGSTFHFKLPYKPVIIEDRSAEVSVEPVDSDLSGKVILIAEDDDNNYAYLEEILLDKKVKIIRAKNGKEAVELCKTNPEIELVLMDIKMPVLNGYEATKQILKFRKDLPIIAQTAYAFLDDREKAMNSGCVDFISKPLKEELLISKITEQLNKMPIPDI